MLNRNVGKYNLSHLWDRVLFNTPGLKIDSSQYLPHLHNNSLAQTIPANSQSPITKGISEHIKNPISLEQNHFFQRTQAFTSQTGMASSSVWENVLLSKAPTFDGVCGMWCMWNVITFHIHHQKWVSWKVKHFPIHQKKPCQLDWQKLVFFEKIGSVLEKLSSLLKIKQNEKSTFIYL